MIPADFHTFRFTSYHIDVVSGEARFLYQLVGESDILDFTETITFDTTGIDIGRVDDVLLDKMMQSCHLALGISYYKLVCPKRIEIVNYTLSKAQADFWNWFYLYGLGQFWVENNLKYSGVVVFPYDEDKKIESIAHISHTNRSLVLIGGGKDSLVSIEMLKKANEDISLFSLRNPPVIDATARASGLPHIHWDRQIDPLLIDIGKTNTSMYNGHIPITGVISFISLLASHLYDFRYIIVSTEHSSSYATMEYLGMPVNHQWSKSIDFEQGFSKYIDNFISKDLSYFSLLRPLSELYIVYIFTRYPELFAKYYHIFSSCNRNFHLGEKVARHWCGICPKCGFVFSLFASFSDKQTLLDIFGKNIFADEGMLPMYRDLLGIGGAKPWECVGEADEVRAAFALAYRRGELEGTPVMNMFLEEVYPSIVDVDMLVSEQMHISSRHSIPQHFADILHIYTTYEL